VCLDLFDYSFLALTIINFMDGGLTSQWTMDGWL